MGRERVADVREDARIEQIDLSATVLLGRRPDDLERRHQWSRSGRSKQEGADVRHRDEVVTAAVADAGERVVLREQRDALARRADARSERRRETADAALDAMAVPLEQRNDPRRGPLLFVRQLGIGMDLRGEREELLTQGLGDGHGGVYCLVATFPICLFRARAHPTPPGHSPSKAATHITARSTHRLDAKEPAQTTTPEATPAPAPTPTSTS